MSAHFAIVGSGPAGFYAADALTRKLPGCAIDIIDRLPTPFGLVRAGVAPDHQSTKGVQRLFERIATKPGVRFLGHVELGRDVAYHELKAIYDAVVIATGCPHDRRLGIPGEALPEVHGSLRFVGWYNGHPDYLTPDPALAGPAVAVIGNGNVAIDCLRVLAKSDAEMASSDLSRHAAERLADLHIERLYMIGRRGPVETSFTPVELAELGALERCLPLVDGDALERDIAAADPEAVKAKAKVLEALRRFAENKPGGKPLQLHFLFWSTPLAILGSEHVEGLRLQRKAGAAGEVREETLRVETIVTAIGYRAMPFAGPPHDDERGIVKNEDGRVEPGVYVVGWAKRGPSGTIPTNRADSYAVVESIAADLAQADSEKPGGAALDRLLAERGARPVSFADWQRINAAEIARAAAGRPREKFTRIEELLEAAREKASAS